MEILYIILWWLLGILGHWFIKRIDKSHRKSDLEKLIQLELKDIKRRLSSVPFLIYSKYWILSSQDFSWFKENTREDKKFHSTKDLESEEIDTMTLIEHINTSSKKNRPNFHFKQIQSLILEWNIIDLFFLDTRLTQELLEIKFQIRTYNEKIQDIDYYNKRTFDWWISTGNHEIISQNIENKNLEVAKTSRHIVDNLNYILEKIL